MTMGAVEVRSSVLKWRAATDDDGNYVYAMAL